MSHRTSIIDTRHKTILNPYIQKGREFGKVFCQYTVFEQEVRFVECTFHKDVIFGEEDFDRAYCVVKSDLVFEKCTFKRKVKLDGLQCAGHVIFKGNCKFEYGDENHHFDYALSLSNATIGLGICIQDSTFKAGINLSATHINQVGCQLVNVKIKNQKSEINFCSSYMAKEFSINASNIICRSFNFEGLSVDDVQGAMLFKGIYLDSKNDQTITTELVNSKFGIEISDYEKIVSLYRINDNPNSPILLVRESKEEKYTPQQLGQIFKLASNIDDKIKLIYYDGEGSRNDGLTPLGDISLLKNGKDKPGYLSIIYQGTTSVVDLENHQIHQLDLIDTAKFIFKGLIKEDTGILKYHCRSHRSVPMIYARHPSGDWSENIYIAIYDLNHNYKVYKWNYIKCELDFCLSQTNVGRGLYINQSEFDVTNIDMHALSARHELVFEDIVFNSYNIDVSPTKISNIRFHNIDFVCKDIYDYCGVINDFDSIFGGINFECSNITNKLVLENITVSNYEENFKIKANLLTIKNILSIKDFRHDDITSVRIDMKNSQLNQLFLNQLEWNNTTIETENLCFNGIILDGEPPKFKQIAEKVDKKKILLEVKIINIDFLFIFSNNYIVFLRNMMELMINANYGK